MDIKLQALLAAKGIELNLTPAQETDKGPIYTTDIPGGEPAVELWRKLRALVDETGHWPLLGTKLPQESFDERSAADWLAEADRIDVPAWFAGRSPYDPEGEIDADEWAEMAEEMGIDPPAYGPISRFSTPYDVLSRQPLASLPLVLVPTRKCWEVAAYIGFGGWNACPDPAHQVAIQRYWHQKYGAEAVAITHDILELQVARPPRTDAEALALALEQEYFCDDIVHQGVMSLENLKLTLLGSELWYFWWD